MSLNTTGVMNNVNTILGLIQRLEPVIAAIPEVKGLIEAAISTFSSEDKEAVEAAYSLQIAKTDADHQETQAELAKVAGGEAEEGGEQQQQQQQQTS